MALIKCPECKKKVSESAGKCPNCGFDLSSYTPPAEKELTEEERQIKKEGPIFFIVIIILAAMGLFFISNKGDNTSHRSSTQNSPRGLSVSAAKRYVKRHLKDSLKDPSSLEIMHWDIMETADRGAFVRVKYRAKNGFGGYDVYTQIFTLSSNGEILKDNDY